MSHASRVLPSLLIAVLRQSFESITVAPFVCVDAVVPAYPLTTVRVFPLIPVIYKISSSINKKLLPAVELTIDIPADEATLILVTIGSDEIVDVRVVVLFSFVVLTFQLFP